jgi:hypothetical protein
MDVRFVDHAKFHRAAAGMVGGATALSLALHPLTAFAPVLGGVGGIAFGAALAHGRPRWRLASALVAGGALTVLSGSDLAMTTLAPLLAALSIAFGVGLAVGVRGVRGVIALAAGAAVPLAATWCALRFAGIAGAAMGAVGVLAMLPRHLVFATDPVAAAVRRLPAGLATELRELCDRSVAIWTSAKRDLANEPGLALVQGGVVDTLDVAVRAAQVTAAGPGDAEIATRIADLDGRIAAASDAEVKVQYESARAALADQQRYRDRQRTGRERLIARMHSHVAALEKFHLAATTLPTAPKLAELSSEVAASGEAMGECLEAATV